MTPMTTLPPLESVAAPTAPEPPAELDRDVGAAARELAARWRAGDRADPELRAACAEALAALRGEWRRRPAAFDGPAVALLRDVARELSAPAVAPGAAEHVLGQVFGYDAFRPGQREIIDAVLAGRDCVGVMPTGAGKSLTYQIPARILGGTTLVVSPLIALMKDQVDAMNEVGLRATYLSSTLEPEERERRVRALAAANTSSATRRPRGSRPRWGGCWPASICASSPSTRPTASATGATTSAPPTAT